VNITGRLLNGLLGRVGLEVRRIDGGTASGPTDRTPVELSPEERRLVDHVADQRLSMASRERLWATAMACRHVIERDVPGDFVECGVWRGGNALLAAALFRLHRADRRVYLFDTFGGMTVPTERDRSAADGAPALEKFQASQQADHNEWCYASLQDVRANFAAAGLLGDNVTFVQGDVLRTLEEPRNLPARIAVLRLDTDWYESTRKELEVLYPRLSTGGALIIDDYGHWAGARQATDEYFATYGGRPFLQYTDYTGRLGIKY
jgi:hypothetical protein